MTEEKGKMTIEKPTQITRQEFLGVQGKIDGLQKKRKRAF
jgi:hypothetical protein